jgi:hypothetical protein
MRSSPVNRSALLLGSLAAWALLAGTGCQSLTQPSGFLTTYTNLVKVDSCLWRYVDTNRLATYNTFVISSVKVLVKDYEAAPISPAERQAAANRFRDDIVQALSGSCQLLDKPTTNSAEIRAAITTAFPVGDFLTFGMEAEIVDAYSGRQVAAVRFYEAGNPLATGWTPDASSWTGAWWDRLSAKFFMQQCSTGFRKAIVNARQSAPPPGAAAKP